MSGSMVLTTSGSWSTKAGSCALMFARSASRSADGAAAVLFAGLGLLVWLAPSARLGLMVWLPPSARVRLASSVRRSTGGSSVLV